MKAYKGSVGIAPFLLNLGIRRRTTSDQLHAPAASSPQRNPGILGWAPEPVLTFWIRKISPTPAKIRTPKSPHLQVLHNVFKFLSVSYTKPELGEVC
jgi:hypothetical protein